METTDIVIHKGEKEEKYQLYVEDYVMSFLKNYGTANGRKIFFYGTREQKNRKYYIYGAGQQKNISYFVRYELLDEIVCRFDMDKPVFFIKEDSGRYELSGYYIFYQSNEAMQSYMIELRKGHEEEENTQEKFRPQGKSEAQNKFGAQDRSESQNKIRPQDFSDIRTRRTLKTSDEEKGNGSEKQPFKGGIMAFQLSAVFLVLAAIIINSTNSYPKLRELGQSAVEVFFTMENQEASKKEGGKTSGGSEISEVSKDAEMPKTQDDSDLSGESVIPDAVDGTQGTVLRLEDLDAEFEKENQEAKEDTDNTGGQDKENNSSDSKSDKENNSSDTESDKENNSSDTESDKESIGSDTESDKGNIGSDTESDKGNSGSNTEADKENVDSEASKEEDNANASSTEERPSQEAFARDFAQYYKIEKGDTLCNISIKLYGDASKVNEICEINKIDNPDNIKYGQKILLP